MSNPITTPQIIKFNALLRQLNLGEEIKRSLILQYTNNRSDRTNDMFFDEGHDMITYLQALVTGNPKIKKSQDKEAGQRMRRKIISLTYQLGWTDVEDGKIKVDMDRLNAFLVERGAVRGPKIKTINDYNNGDLRTIVTQFEQMVKHHLDQFKK
jgi:hypothetical protein